MLSTRLILPCMTFWLAAAPALASSSATVAVQGGSVRLVTSGLAGPEGRLRGAIEIRLEPGWKTYWRDPGASGVPPSLDLADSRNVTGAEIDFPAPQWHRDDYGSWAGYDRSVSLPVTFTIPRPERFSVIEADIFLGICETICIPVQARLIVEPGTDPDNAQHRSTVEAAYAALPPAASDGFGLTAAAWEGPALRIEANLPADAPDPELFLAGSNGYAFAPPVLQSRDGATAVFTAEMVESPAGIRPGPGFDYTLVAGERAVSGRLPQP